MEDPTPATEAPVEAVEAPVEAVAEAAAAPEAAAPAPAEAADEAEEAEASEEEGDAPKGAYEGSQVVTGKRQRKSAEKLEYDHDRKKKAAAGGGTALGDMDAVMALMSEAKRKEDLLNLHMLVFKAKGAKGKHRRNLSAFSGVVYGDAGKDVERERYAARAAKHKTAALHGMLDLLRVDRSAKSFEGGKADKDALVDRLLDFLEAPGAGPLQKAAPKRAPAKKRASSTAKKAAPKKKQAAPKKKAAGGADEELQVALFRAVADARFAADASLDHRELMAACEDAVGRPLKCTEFKAVCKAIVAGEQGEDDDDDDDDDAPIKRKRGAPKKRASAPSDDDDDAAEVVPVKKARGAPKARAAPAESPADEAEAEAAVVVGEAEMEGTAEAEMDDGDDGEAPPAGEEEEEDVSLEEVVLEAAPAGDGAPAADVEMADAA